MSARQEELRRRVGAHELYFASAVHADVSMSSELRYLSSENRLPTAPLFEAEFADEGLVDDRHVRRTDHVGIREVAPPSTGIEKCGKTRAHLIQVGVQVPVGLAS